jgi:multicomponent K+:H+ antiporter subunit A
MALAAGAWPFLHRPLRRRPAAPGRPGPRWPALVGRGHRRHAGTRAGNWRQRLLALVLMGAVGLVVCLVLRLPFGARPGADAAAGGGGDHRAADDAGAALAARRWRHAAGRAAARRRWRDAALALAVGGRGALVWQVLTRPGCRSATTSCRPPRCPLGGGSQCGQRDHRRLPRLRHLGEITVLGIAGMTMHALLARLPGAARPAWARPGRPDGATR